MRHLIPLGMLLLAAAPLVGQDRSRSPHGELALECRTCHKSEGWTPVAISKTFDHAKFGFVLAGAHQTATCRACHESLDFKGVQTQCTACHLDIHRGELGADCGRCHTSRSFLDHDVMIRAHQLTRFPLVGSHLATDCTACHAPAGQGRLQFVSTNTDCVSCHQADYDRTTSPDHRATGYSTDCVNCHQVVPGFAGAFFSHVQFPLTAVHAGLPCTQCHKPGTLPNSTPNTCAGCHGPGGIIADVYTTTTAPPHAASNLSLTCTNCHQLLPAWANATFDHTALTTFPLTASAHLATTCASCHTTQWKGLATTCTPCHQQVFVAQKDPDHVAAGFATAVCTPCHTYTAATTTFAGGTYDHTANTTFPLTGAHIGVDCARCHTTAVYRGLAVACVSCHLADYNGTTNPNHAAAAFPQTCDNCHKVVAGWTGATGGHTAAVTISSSHGNAQCSDCHSSPTDFSVFQCYSACHHTAANTDHNHTCSPKGTSSCSAAGYFIRNGTTYVPNSVGPGPGSSACYTCHPRGSAG